MRGVLSSNMFQCIPEIDFDIGNRYFLGNMENYTKALMSTLKSIKSKLPLLDLMCKTKEFEGLRSILQTLQTMLGNIGAVDLAEETYQVDVVLLNQSVPTVVKKLEEYIFQLSAFSEHLELLMKKAEVNGEVNKSSETFLNYDFTKTKESIKRSSDYLSRRIV